MTFRWPFKLAGIILLILLGLYLVAQARLKSNLETFTANLGDGVQVQYEKATITLAGTVLIKNGTVNIPAQNIYMSVGEIEFSLGSLSNTLFTRANDQITSLPDQIYFRYENAKVMLTSSFVHLIAKLEDPKAFSGLEALGCGAKMHLGIKEYAEMGYDDFVSSGELTIEKKDVVGSLISRLSGRGWSDNHLMARVDFTFDISNVLNDFSEFSKFELLPTVDYLTLHVKDQGYNQRRNDYCARQEKLSVEQYIDNHITLVADTLTSGKLVMSADIQSSYRELLQPGTKVDLSIKPQSTFSFQNLPYYKEKDLRDILGLKIQLNNFDLPEIFVGWTLDKLDDVKVLSPQAIAEKNRIRVIRYHRMPIVQANDYINRQVKVIRTDGETFEGVLVKIESGALRLNMQYQEGNAEIPFEKNRIQQFYVYQ